ncbi:MAG: O-methyltransferase [bacterium]|nr:O-methyltransferase [bacterium]
MAIHQEALGAYLRERALTGEDPLLAEMHELAAERRFPIVGPEVGRFLFQLVRMMNAGRIFEMGSGFGYSALWFARAMEGAGEGEIYVTDSDKGNIQLARKYHLRAGVAERITYLTGYAQDMLQVTPGLFDIIFCDIDKEQYPEIYDIVRKRLRIGGALVVDNLLWSGAVADPEDTRASTEGIRVFTERMWSSPEFASSLLPVRDGLGLHIKIK